MITPWSVLGYPKPCASPTRALTTMIAQSTTSLSLPPSGRDSILGSWSNPLKSPGRSANVMPEILAKLLPPPNPEQKLESEDGDAVAVDLSGNTIETDLFGNPIYPVKRRVK